jgi:hypothetical protein
MLASEWEHQSTRAFGKAVSAERRDDLITDMARVVLDHVVRADPQAEAANRLGHTVEVHRESVGRHEASLLVRRLTRAKLQPQIAISQQPNVFQQLHERRTPSTSLAPAA